MRNYKISAYTTTRNALQMDYPFVASIESMLAFADEVCVFDTSDLKSDDGTWTKLSEMAKVNNKLKVKHSDAFDWTAPNHGIFDGQTKQKAREMCTGTHLWQFDIDEIVHEDHVQLIPELIEKIGAEWVRHPILALPVVEFWGRNGKVRVDVNVWKPRLSINSPNIVHGIPISLRTVDTVTGLPYAKHGTDTCDYINRVTGEPMPVAMFLDENVAKLQHYAKLDQNANAQFEQWFNQTIKVIPGVFHYSWINIERKIRQYKLFWTSFWKAMYNETRDERENAFFPGMLWSEVTDDLIKTKALELEEKTGGWVFHRPWDGSNVKSITVKMSHPKCINEWLKEQK